MKSTENAAGIPTLNPFQLDDYLFSTQLSPTVGWYKNFHIERVEYYRNYLKLPIPPHRRSVYFFMYLSAGSAVRTKWLSTYEIPSGHFFFLPADTTTSVLSLSPDAAGFYCHFTPRTLQHPALKVNLEQDFPFFGLKADPLLPVEDTSLVLPLLEALYAENKRNAPGGIELIAFLLTTLLLAVKHQTPPQILPPSLKNAATTLTERYKSALSTFLYEKNSVAEFAEHLCVSPNHLHKCVKSVTGKTAHELLAEMRILEAKVLLRQSALSIGEIAYKLGKFGQSDFGRFFKSHTGMTPNQYRRMESEKLF